MDASKDYYAILGVLPTAEDIVVRAAYKALAQRYHPDRCDGSKEEANRRMAEINEAYEVLSNVSSRKEYDNSRGTNTQSGDSYFGENSGDTPPAFDPLERDWRVAVQYYPDLAEIDKKLSRISWRLAYSFRAHLLEVRAFDRRAQVAETLEQKFLETYFGTDHDILQFARTLINRGHKAAAKALNEAVRVLGRGVEVERIIRQIRTEFNIEKITDNGTDIPESFISMAKTMRGLGLKETEITAQLVSRGVKRFVAEGIAYTVCHDS
jgi:hypothetical protein